MAFSIRITFSNLSIIVMILIALAFLTEFVSIVKETRQHSETVWPIANVKQDFDQTLNHASAMSLQKQFDTTLALLVKQKNVKYLFIKRLLFIH